MINPLGQLPVIFQNKHTAICAGVFLTAKYGAMIFEGFFPEKFTAIDNAANALEGLAVAWGLLVAGKQNPTSKQAIAAVDEKVDQTTRALMATNPSAPYQQRVAGLDTSMLPKQTERTAPEKTPGAVARTVL